MKKTTLLFLLLFLLGKIFGQAPEQIYSFAKIYKPVSWYKEQKQAWRKVIDKNPKDANAWYNYYRVNRNLSRVDETDTSSFLTKKQNLEKILEEMKSNIPLTYEYNLCRWMEGGGDYEHYMENLINLEKLGEGRTEHYSEMVNWGIVEQNEERQNKYADLWYKSGEMSAGFMYYCYNVMIGTKPNAIIFTSGDNDTYPMWLLQSQGIRKDITVINMSLLLISNYRDKICKKLGVEKIEMSDEISAKEYEKYQNEIILKFSKNTKKYPVYACLTTSPEFTQSIQNKLYLTGLTYQYSDETIDNMAIMKKNFEQAYALDYIDKTFFNDVSIDKVKELNCNYIVPMIKLYEHYQLSGNTQNAAEMKEKIMVIAKQSDKEKEILKYFNQP